MSNTRLAILEEDIRWFTTVLNMRLESYFQGSGTQIPPAPTLDNDSSEYSKLVVGFQMNDEQRLVLLLALLPHLKPDALDPFLIPNASLDRPFTEFGGWQAKNHEGFLPTCETAAWLVSAGNLQQRLEVMKYFEQDHFFIENHVLRIGPSDDFEPPLSRALDVTPECLKSVLSDLST